MICRCCDSQNTYKIHELNLIRCQSCGYAWQTDIQPFIYNSEYVDSYKKTPTLEMSYIRLTVLHKYVKSGRIIDIGYGDGEFIRQSIARGYEAYGYDVNNTVNVPKVNNISGQWDAVTMFDSLEHVEDIEELIEKIYSRYIIITIPHFCPSIQDGEISTWRHYKPNEHLHYFSKKALILFMQKNGYNVLEAYEHEDLIRKSNYKHPNTMTFVFKGAL
jgi:hypothetical protein